MLSSVMEKASFFLLLILFPQFLCSQAKDASSAADATAEVPALSEFHTVIYPLWHTAWPEKNIKMLVELLPEIDKLSADLFAAKLPGILREKKTAWDNGMRELKTILQSYQAASSPPDSVKLLAAAEQLHTQYERLVRVLRPAVKELDTFHSVLYMLYHHYLPEWKLEQIRVSVTELRVKMDLLNNAQLSKRQESKKEAFTAARLKLEAAVKELEVAVQDGEKKVISDKIEAMHTQYRAVDAVFNGS